MDNENKQRKRRRANRTKWGEIIDNIRAKGLEIDWVWICGSWEYHIYLDRRGDKFLTLIQVRGYRSNPSANPTAIKKLSEFIEAYDNGWYDTKIEF